MYLNGFQLLIFGLISFFSLIFIINKDMKNGPEDYIANSSFKKIMMTNNLIISSILFIFFGCFIILFS